MDFFSEESLIYFLIQIFYELLEAFAKTKD